MAGIDSLFLGLCLHICASFDDLEGLIKGLDRRNRKIAHLFRIRRCVDVHNRIYSYISQMKTIFGLIIFLQYLTSTFMLCSLVFQILSAFSINRLLASLALMCASAFQLFIYSFFGSQISAKAAGIANAYYDCLWYERPCGERLHYLFMISRAQTETGIRAFQYLSCSLESFRKVT
jgi:odorant receptor